MARIKGSDNEFPKVLLVEGAAAATPAAGLQALYVKSADGKLYRKDDAGTETEIGVAVADILDLATAETDDALVLAPDGAGGVEFRAEGAAGAAAVAFVIDGGGATITTGVKGFVQIPFACTITAVRLLADQSGSIVVDIWKDTYANYPPTDADSITASAVPTISSAAKSEDATLTGWTTSVSAGDILGYNVDSVTTHQRVTVVLELAR